MPSTMLMSTPGHERAAAGLGAVGGDAVVHQFADGGVVGDDEPVEPPLVAQDAGEQGAVGRGGGAADLVERRHQRLGPGVDGGPERRQDTSRRVRSDRSAVL